MYFETLIQYEGLYILVARVQLNPRPHRRWNLSHREYTPLLKKERGNKQGYMLYINRAKPFLSEGGFGYRVHTKKYLYKLIDYIIAYYKTYLQKNGQIATQEDLDAFRSTIPDILREHVDIGFKDYFPTFYDMLNEFNASTGLVDDLQRG